MEQQGIYQATSRGFGFFTPDTAKSSKQEDWFVPPKCEGGAWHGDTVVAVQVPDHRGGNRHTASVTKILHRANKIVTGTLHRQGRDLWLQPTSEKLPNTIKILGQKSSYHGGDRAAVAVSSYGTHKLPPTGTVHQIFGREGTRQAAVDSILYNYHISPSFPAEVLAQAKNTPQSLSPADLEGREDLRGQTIITIDGDYSKDFDDAVSLSQDAQGNWVLGVHIAHVSHYVTEGSPLDLEAWERGTSVYYADQVVPMLPVALSNGICSLNPQVDRLTLSCFLTVNQKAEVVNSRFAQTVICSTERMTYRNCNTLLAGTDPALAERYSHILPMLQQMAGLAKQMESRRRLRGALDLESPECILLCDGEGDPAGVALRSSGVSEQLIESFMLAANEAVAEHLDKLKLPGVFRIHEKPSEDKTQSLKTLLAPLGFDLKTADNYSLQAVLKAVQGKPEAPAIHMMVLRSLMKARYDVENLGHFGLAAPYYCHFTSPIRRYPDLMVHRLLTKLLTTGIPHQQKAKLATIAQKAAEQSSDRELAAQNAEREIERCYFAQYMSGHLGEVFPGTVAGVTRFGLFIALANGIEGLLPLTALPEDDYTFDEAHLTLKGRKTKAVYGFGSCFEVLCAAANVSTGQIDFTLPDVAVSGSSRPAHVKRSRPKVSEKKQKSGYRPPKRGKGRRR